MLTECAHRVMDDWHGGTRDQVLVRLARWQAVSVIEVLREMGCLNEIGLAKAQSECGPLSRDSLLRMQGLVPPPVSPTTPSD